MNNYFIFKTGSKDAAFDAKERGENLGIHVSVSYCLSPYAGYDVMIFTSDLKEAEKVMGR